MSTPQLDTSRAIRDALALARTEESITAIKTAVARAIKAVDAGVTVETTEYFNHSFAPDLVLNWRREGAKAERYVFVRFNDEPEWISEELPRLARRHPVVFGLTPSAVSDGDDAKALAAAVLARESVEAETLVTDPAGVDTLAAVPHSGLGGFVSRTLVRGGRGLVDRDGATRATTEIVGGFEAARQADPADTRAAVQATQEFMRRDESTRVIRFLQAMWIASGAPKEAFPGAVGEAADPGDEALRFLIGHDEIADPDFWRALGASLTIERLANLGVQDAPVNLQHLIEANLDRLWARAVRVRHDQPRLNEVARTLLWRVERGLLALSGSNFTAYVGTNVDEVSEIKPDDSPGVTVDLLRARARSVAIDTLELTNGQRVVTYGSSDQQTDVAGDPALSALAETLGTPTVRRAAITVAGRHLDLDFVTATATARTSARPPLTDILGVGLPLLWPLSEEDRTVFVAMLMAAREQQSLDMLIPLDAEDTAP